MTFLWSFHNCTVSDINQKYFKEGLAGIPDKPHPGRPRRLTEEQELAIKEMILTKLPYDVGFPAEFKWTAGLVAKYIKREYNFEYSIRGITKMFKRLNLSYTRPTYVLAKADKQKQEQFKKDFEEVEIRYNVNAFLDVISAEPEAVIQRLCCRL